MDTNSPRGPSQRHSPVASLASLEFLQNQRRGSITDPSLHAAQLNSSYRTSSSYRPSADQQGSVSSTSSSAQHESGTKSLFSDPQPSSPYVFGDATPHSVEPGSQLRKILHSPSEQNTHRPIPSLSNDSQGSSRLTGTRPSDHSRNLYLNETATALNLPKDQQHMDVDNERSSIINRRSFRDPPSFDFSMRRHSIAVGPNPITLPNLSTLHGTKRKMSEDRNVFPPVGEDDDPQLVGPGIPSIMDVDVDAPAPKRRGSTIDTHRIAQLSLNDRRNSVDSRSNHWSHNDRRESAPSLFPPVSVPGINSFNTNFNSADPQHGRIPSSLSAFSWPSNSQASETSSSSLHNGPSHTTRAFDPVHQSNTIPPPVNYLADRRMSVPDNLTHPSSSRSIHSRSRPPSRQNTDHSGVSSGQEEASVPSLSNAMLKPPSKEPGSTPYSRSPELRVSHKLAERKRRKEMKDLFDELREQLPSDRGMKASKWEILSKAIEYVTQLKQSHKIMEQEIITLKQQLGQQRSDQHAGFSQGPPAASNHPAYGQPPSLYPSQLMQQSHAPLNQAGHPDSRPNSTQSIYPPPPLNSSSQNGSNHRDPHST